MAADLLDLIRTQLGKYRRPADWIQGVKLVTDVLHGKLGRLVLAAELGSRDSQRRGCRRQQRSPNDSRR